MRSVRTDRPIENATLALLREVDGVMSALGLPYFVAGAMARDILLTHIFDLGVHRATADVDFAVAVKDWDEFEAAKTALEDRQFVRDTALTHRLYKNEYPVDIIPFGGVESSEKTIAWPPELTSVMNVAGYREAFDAAEKVRIESGLVLRVVSLPGLAVLKLFAWGDRGHEDSKDALDFATLLQSYPDAGNQQRLYDDAIDVMEVVDFKIDLAGARLLGRDARHMIAEDTRKRLAGILGDRRQRDRLTIAMAGAWGRTEDATFEAERLLEQFRNGLEGT